ncbi:MAG TPA: hypothetical protein VLX90_18895 [Steroidobacteraceae bacterium]|nr:hypothetical protein [Steroidobacteraceae bacterium]
MNAAVIVLSDLFLSPETALELPAQPGLSALALIARFGDRQALPGGWREWVAHWARSAGGGSASARTPVAPATAAATVAAAAVWRERQVWIRPDGASSPATVWLASPVHLLTGLATAHLDRRGILRLSPDEKRLLAEDFRGVFAGTGFALIPLHSDGFLLSAPELPLTAAPEPARCVGENLAVSLAVRSGAPLLRQLGAEIEMWLHGHALNSNRQQAGLPPITALWLWGGGPAPREAPAAASPVAVAAFGADPFVDGLWSAGAAAASALPAQSAEVFGYAGARPVLVVEEVGRMLHSHPQWLLPDALAEFDRSLLAPAVQRLRGGQLESLHVLANDRCLSLRRSNLLRFWRRRLRAEAAFR